MCLLRHLSKKRISKSSWQSLRSMGQKYYRPPNSSLISRGLSNSPGSCILFTVVKCDRGGRARPSPALVRKETAKSFRVVAAAFPEGRESPNSCLGLHKRRARIRKNGPTTEEGGSPSSECYYYEAGLRGSGRLQGAAGGVRGSYRRALRRSERRHGGRRASR